MDHLGVTQISIGVAALAAAVLIYWTLVPRRFRPAFLLLLSGGFAFLLGTANALYILLNAAIGYAASRVMANKEGAARRRLIKLALAWIIGTFCYFKVGPVLPSFVADALPFETAAILLPLGLSYVLFRIMHFTIEVYRGRIDPESPSIYGAYVLFFPTFLAGPLERYPRFLQQTREIDRFQWGDLTAGSGRIVLGAFKKAVIAMLLAPRVMGPLQNPAELDVSTLFLCAWGLIIYVYFDFSGYTDMALGAGRLFGYRVIENFNYPFIRASIAEFWRNWHMSLYSFIRDYFFYPVFGRSVSPARISLGLVTTMIVFMLWHKVSVSWFMLGLYHGLALVVWNAFQDFKRPRPRLRNWLKKPYARVLSWAFTMTFISFGMLFFFFPIEQVLAVFRQLLGAA